MTMDTRSRPVVIAGGGIAGLTAALAFAQRGFAVEIYEQAPRLETVGAGIQLSPNATRILASLGVLERLLPMAVRPETVVLKDAANIKERARVPLGRLRRTALAGALSHSPPRRCTGGAGCASGRNGGHSADHRRDAHGYRHLP
nr:NAD(P)-binding protein [Mesorhizobium amorphae]